MHEDAASNQSSVSSASGFITDATADTTDPVIGSVFFDEANDEIDLTFTEANFPVTVYWQVRAVASGAPNQAAMIANTGGLDGGNYSVASSPDSEAIDLSALADGDYTLYVMLKDPSDNYSTISDDDFTLTTPDVTAPTLSSATDAKNGENASTGSVSTNEDNGTLYWVITTSATSPSAAQVKAGNDHTGAGADDSGSATVSATGVQNMTGSGLSASTAYYTHFMHEDTATNQSSVASASGFTTDASADVTAPTLSSPTDAANGATASTGSVSTDEGNGTLYWVVTTSGTAPSAAQVKAGQDNSSVAATAGGSQAVSATGVQNIAPSGLTASTAYTTHFMHEDAASNQSTVVSASGFTTDAASGGAIPTVEGTASGAENANTGLYSFVLPTSLENDLVIITLTSDAEIQDGATGAVSNYLNDGHGYTILHDGVGTSNPGRLIAYKFMGATPDTSVDVFIGPNKGVICTSAAIRGVNQTTPVDGTMAAASGATGLPDAPSYTTSQADCLRMIIGMLDDDNIIMTAPAGWSNAQAGSDSSNAVAANIIAFKDAATAGADDPAAFGGVGGDDEWTAYHLAFRGA
jgi:hypothetical protein